MKQIHTFPSVILEKLFKKCMYSYFGMCCLINDKTFDCKTFYFEDLFLSYENLIVQKSKIVQKMIFFIKIAKVCLNI